MLVVRAGGWLLYLVDCEEELVSMRRVMRTVVSTDALEAAPIVIVAPVCCSLRCDVQQPGWREPSTAERTIKTIFTKFVVHRAL